MQGKPGKGYKMGAEGIPEHTEAYFLHEQKPPTKVDYVYKRCYVDKQGNVIDPRTFWDELLKYYRHGELLLVSEGEKLATPVPLQASREIRAEEAKRTKRAQISRMEAEDLERRGERRKRTARRRIEQCEAQVLGLRDK